MGDAAHEALLAERFREWRRLGDSSLRDALIVEHRSIAEACARRFADRGEPLDDLIQVATLGLVKSVERFDPDAGVPFAGYAVPTVMGELRRHFRDATWAVHVPRRAKDLHVRLPVAIEELSRTLGRSPRPDDLAKYLSVGVDDILDAIDAGAAYRPASMDTPATSSAAETSTHGTTSVASPSPPNEDRTMLADLLGHLPERERRIVYLRFFEDMSQSEIADEVGTSQVHVSRLLRSSLKTLRDLAGSLDG